MHPLHRIDLPIQILPRARLVSDVTKIQLKLFKAVTYLIPDIEHKILKKYLNYLQYFSIEMSLKFTLHLTITFHTNWKGYRKSLEYAVLGRKKTLDILRMTMFFADY